MSTVDQIGRLGISKTLRSGGVRGVVFRHLDVTRIYSAFNYLPTQMIVLWPITVEVAEVIILGFPQNF